MTARMRVPNECERASSTSHGFYIAAIKGLGVFSPLAGLAGAVGALGASVADRGVAL